MEKSIEILYNWDNNLELEIALKDVYGDTYKLMYDESGNITPSILWKEDSEFAGAIFFKERCTYKIIMHPTHMVFDPQVAFVELKRKNKNQK
jgi:hypothetical protein